MHTPRPLALVALAVLAGTVMVILLGLLTSGVQATSGPRGLPVAIAVPDGASESVRQAAQRVAGRGGDQVAWRVTSPQEASRLLDDKVVYGVLAVGEPGTPATVVLSGAVNPGGTQAAQQVLTAAGQTLWAGAWPVGTPLQPVAVQMVHPASPAARAVPLAASALLWLGTLVGSVLLVVASHRVGRPTTAVTRVATAAGVAAGTTVAVLGLMALWDSGLRMDARLVGFLLLAAFAFAAVQGAVLRLTGLVGMAVLAPLYLIAPAVAGQVPELLHPAYRALLWSWTPFRFSTEGVRSLLLLDTVPPDVRTAIWVLTGMAVAGLAVLLWPGRRSDPPPDVDEAAASQPVPSAA